MSKLSRKERAVQESLGIEPEITICAHCTHFGGRFGRYSYKCLASPAESHTDRITGEVKYWRAGHGYVRSKSYQYSDASEINNCSYACTKFTYNTRSFWQSLWFVSKRNWRTGLITFLLGCTVFFVFYIVKGPK